MLSQNKVELLLAIYKKLERGDIKKIAEDLKFSRVYVGYVLSPHTRYYKQEIVDAAIKIITEREQNTKNLLEKLNAA